MVVKAKIITQAPINGVPVFAIDPMRAIYEPSGGPPITLHAQKAAWWGVCVHTTGGGVEDLAKKRGWTPSEAMCWVYSQEWSGHPHYGIDWNGIIYRITDTNLIAVHCGAKKWMRDRMLDGSWTEHVSDIGLKHWKARWPGVPSPQHLFPGSSGNAAYIGIEMIPLSTKLYSPAQYASLIALLRHLRTIHNIDYSNPKKLVGHEDLIPFMTADGGRWDSKGGWDPGFLRDVPRFDWARVKAGL